MIQRHSDTLQIILILRVLAVMFALRKAACLQTTDMYAQTTVALLIFITELSRIFRKNTVSQAPTYTEREQPRIELM